jgi:hypothetical protein
MYSSQSLSSSTSGSGSLLRSEALRADPTARQYLITGAGLAFLGTIADARQWFPLGYEIRDPGTRERVDIGSLAVPLFAKDPETFGVQKSEEDAGRERLATTKSTPGEHFLS